jgi:hypothetical protein
VLCPFFVNRFLLRSVGKISYKKYTYSVFIIVVFWMIASASFLLYLISLFNESVIGLWVEVVGAYLFSWWIGFVSIFAPQGVGVFESVAAVVMPIKIHFTEAVGFLVGFRFVIMLADICMWICWSCWRFYKYRWAVKLP